MYQNYQEQPYYSDRSPLTAPASGYGQQEYHQHKDKFPERPAYRDVFFAILFIFHLIGMGVVFGVGLAKGPVQQQAEDTINTITNDWLPEFTEILYIAAGCIALGGVVSFMWLLIIRKFARQLIYITLALSVMVWLGLAVMCLVIGSLISAVIFAAIAGLNALFYYWWRKRIPFAVAMLKTISDRIQDFPATAYTAYLGLAVQMAWMIFWIWTATLVERISNGGVTWAVALFVLLSLYWTIQVIKNVVHVTVGGVFASWYFYSGTVGIPSNPTLKSFKRATTTSFGSICLGSLLVAILQTIRTLLRSLRRESDNLIACLAECLIGCIENLLQYFNIYAFAQVAIYGKSYCQAAKDTWHLISSHGIQAIINDDLISGVLTMGVFVGGCICGGVAAAVGYVTIPHYWIACAVIGFLIGFIMALNTMEVVQSGVSTVFVCFAMDPLALKRNDPFLYQKFKDSYGHCCDLFV